MAFALPSVTFNWRPTTDAQRVFAMHTTAIAGTPPGMVRPDRLLHFEEHMGRYGETIGCFLDSGEMIAYGVLGLRSPTVEYLADLLGADQHRFAVLDGAAALAQWRGFGLHYGSVAERLRYAASLERSQVGATVAPENVRSVRSLLRAGMTVQGFGMMYGGLPRLVVHIDTLQAERSWQHEISVPLNDHASHQAALASRLTGYACRRNVDGVWAIDYGL